MAEAARRASRYSLFAEITLYLSVIGTVACLGGASDWALVPATLLPPVALGFAAVGALRQGQRLRIPLLVWPALLTAAICLFQLLPFPLPVLRWLSPMKADLVEFALKPIGLSSFRSISLDPPSTWRELGKAVAYGTALLCASQIGRSRTARRRLFRTVAFLGASVVLVGVGHAALGVTRLFGVYAFSSEPPVLTFFGNPNHLAGFLSLTSTVALGLLLEEKKVAFRFLLGTTYLLSGAGVLLTLSRGGICFFVLVQVLLAGWTVFSNRTKDLRPSWKRGVWALSAVALVMAVALALGFEQLSVEYESADSLEKLGQSKMSLWPQFARAALDYWRFGMGRGTFALGYLRSQTEAWPSIFTHPENLVIQLLAEVGFLPALILLVMTGYAFSSLFRRTDLSSADRGVLLGALSVFLHNLLDFSLELPAVPLALAIVIGAVSRKSETPNALPRGLGREQWMLKQPLAMAAATLGIGVACVSLGFPTYLNAEQKVTRALADHLAPKPMESLVKPLIDRHPADGILYAALGWSNLFAGKPDLSLAWLERAMWLDPFSAPLHRATARSLLALGQRGQAFLEYRQALSSSLGNPQPGLPEEALFQAKTPEERLALCPKDADFVSSLAQRMWAQGHQQEAVQLTADMLEELPKDKSAVQLFAFLATAKRVEKDYGAAAEYIRQGELLDETDPRWILEHVSLLSDQGHREEALNLLRKELKERSSDVQLWFRLAWMQFEFQNRREALAALDRARPLVTSLGERKQLLQLDAYVQKAIGRLSRAVEAARAWTSISPTEPAPHYLLADLYEQQGLWAEAKQQWTDGLAVDFGPDKPTAQDKLSHLKERMEHQEDQKLGTEVQGL